MGLYQLSDISPEKKCRTKTITLAIRALYKTPNPLLPFLFTKDFSTELELDNHETHHHRPRPRIGCPRLGSAFTKPRGPRNKRDRHSQSPLRRTTTHHIYQCRRRSRQLLLGPRLRFSKQQRVAQASMVGSNQAMDSKASETMSTS